LICSLVVHCTGKLAARLRDVAATPLAEAHPLTAWHAGLYHVDRRQCVLFCHDESRFVLFMPGLRKEHFADLANACFKPLLTATLAALGCSLAQLVKVAQALGPARFDTAVDRSVLSAMNIVIADELYPRVARAANVLDLDAAALSCEMSERPTRARGKLLWPDRRMLEIVATL
jgi:hypothetical protein